MEFVKIDWRPQQRRVTRSDTDGTCGRRFGAGRATGGPAGPPVLAERL